MPRPILRRRQYIIKKGLQFRYIGLVFGLALIASFVTGWTVFATGWHFLGEKLASVYPQGRLVYVLRATNLALVRNLLLISPLIFILGLLFSHRIAGPVYRIGKTLEDITKGNLGLRIRLREGDELVDLADTINNLTGNFNKTIILDKDIAIKIEKDLEEIKKLSSSQPCDCAKIGALISSLQEKSKELSASFNKWTAS
ncbi:MAG: methyl-accepting chemotaxis protein [Candidatus Omnitrophica bacterium]|nr:methyl-accepting chemotaxis protein [Candidatus Omnitrophota bacterium]